MSREPAILAQLAWRSAAGIATLALRSKAVDAHGATAQGPSVGSLAWLRAFNQGRITPSAAAPCVTIPALLQRPLGRIAPPLGHLRLNFSDLGLALPLQRALADMGLYAPTPIQQQAIGPAVQGADVWATAPTGSGKTLAFALPLLHQHLLRPRQTNFRRPLRTLVLVPTRELAVQVGDVWAGLAYPLGIKVAVVFGGVSINPQMMALRGGADVVVATPGRLLDLVAHNALRLADVQHWVLDEADRLLDLGFSDELKGVLALLPAKRQTMLFSATFAAPVQALAAQLLRPDAQRITADAFAGHAPRIAQRAIAVDEGRRTALLRHLLDAHDWPQVLVFVATRYACDLVAHKLARAGVAAAPLHGQMSQGARQDVLGGFKAGHWRVVVTTDLASRGLDVAQLPVVLNYDLPRSASDYTHRIGRTGRAGQEGLAVSLVTAHALAHWRLICKREGLGSAQGAGATGGLEGEGGEGGDKSDVFAAAQAAGAALECVPGFEPTEAAPPPVAAADGTGGIKGRRPSKKDKLRAQAAQQAQ